MGVREWPELNKRRCLKEEKQRLWNWTVSKFLFVILFVYRILLIFLKLTYNVEFSLKTHRAGLHMISFQAWNIFLYDTAPTTNSKCLIIWQLWELCRWLCACCHFLNTLLRLTLFFSQAIFFFSWSLNRSFGLPITKFSELIFPREAPSVSFGIELVLFRCTQYICSILRHKLHFNEFNIYQLWSLSRREINHRKNKLHIC